MGQWVSQETSHRKGLTFPNQDLACSAAMDTQGMTLHLPIPAPVGGEAAAPSALCSQMQEAAVAVYSPCLAQWLHCPSAGKKALETWERKAPSDTDKN